MYFSRNEAVIASLQEFLNSLSFKSIHVFLPIENNHEPDVRTLFPGWWREGKMILTSSTDFVRKEMHHFILEEGTKLVVNHKGIPEPMNAKEGAIEDIQVILIPLLVADLLGNRIGYGGGYYDRLLHETKAVKIGLSLSPPLDKIEQVEDWDIRLDHLITPFKLYNYG